MGTEINDPNLQRVCRASTLKLAKFCVGNNPFSSYYATCKSQWQQTTLEIDLLRLRELQKFWKNPSNKICQNNLSTSENTEICRNDKSEIQTTLFPQCTSTEFASTFVIIKVLFIHQLMH